MDKMLVVLRQALELRWKRGLVGSILSYLVREVWNRFPWAKTN